MPAAIPFICTRNATIADQIKASAEHQDARMLQFI
jgi:hypothetical protein